MKNTEHIQQTPQTLGSLPSAPPPANSQLVQNQPISPKPKGKKKVVLIILGILAGLILAVFATVFIWYKTQLAPKTTDDVYHVLVVQSGASRQSIAYDLEEKQIIKSSSVFLWHTKLTGKSNLQAGSYRLSSKLSTPEIADILASGKVSTVDILIPPGLRLSQIKAELVKAGYGASEIDQALISVRSHPLLKNVSSSTPLEGYLFPDTYRIGPDTTAEQLITLMLNTFEKKITAEIKTGLAKQRLSLEEGIILASIIQKEVSDYPNMQKVAQVFLKRLNEGVVLGSDVTFQYAAKETGKAEVPTLDSPYNTRIVAGLPPSAIANFNIDALRSVAEPATTDFLYFVAGDDGTVYYSKTEAEHEALTRQHCKSCFQ